MPADTDGILDEKEKKNLIFSLFLMRQHPLIGELVYY
jgi:hypothetical protein